MTSICLAAGPTCLTGTNLEDHSGYYQFLPLCSHAAVGPHCHTIPFWWLSYSLLRIAIVPATEQWTDFSLLSFLALCHSWFLTTLGFHCLMASDHCLFSGCWLALFFSFFEFYPYNKLLTFSVCCTISITRESIGLSFIYGYLFGAELSPSDITSP